MREIKFRGQTRRKGERLVNMAGDKCDSNWVYGGIFSQNEDDKGFAVIYQQEPEVKKYPVYADTVGQYTGLKDKNGKEIYEGDIVRYQFDNDDCPFPNKHTEKIIGRIFFSDFRASFSVTAGRKCSSMLNNDLFKYVQNGNRVEVIGNVFDNPELLEGSEWHT